MNGWQRRLLGLVTARVGLSDERLIVAPNVTVFVHERMRQLGLPDEDALVRHLALSDLDWQAFLSSLLNGQTCFFRDREQLDAVISVLVERQREVSRRLHLWSAGCSTGEEPYSLAVLAARAGLDLDIWATDLNVAALSHARRASYGAWSLRHLQDDLRFGFLDEEAGCRVRPELAVKVRFARHNLLRDPTFRSPLDDGGWDLILCRNVLIYYTPDDAADVARRLAAALTPGGSLGLGASEGVAGLSAGIPAEQRFGRVFYRGERGGDARPVVRAPLSTPTAPSASTSQELALPAWQPAPPPVASPEIALPAPAQRGFFAVERKVTELVLEGRFPDAARLLEELLDDGPDDVMAMLALGHLELRRHAFERALAMYARVQAHDPLLSEGHLFEGVAQRKRGAHASARQAFQRVLFLDPACWPASYLLTGTLERLDKDAEATRERRRALQLLEEHGAKASSSSSLSLGLALLPDPEECLARLRALHRRGAR